jgi:hypothetical protein
MIICKRPMPVLSARASIPKKIWSNVLVGIVAAVAGVRLRLNASRSMQLISDYGRHVLAARPFCGTAKSHNDPEVLHPVACKLFSAQSLRLQDQALRKCLASHNC